MRTLGPGSVSSFLKIILDVVYVALWVGVAAAGLSSLAALTYGLSEPAEAAKLDLGGETLTLVTVTLFFAAAYMGGVQIIVDQLRRIFATLTVGDPFHPDNVRRLRVVGLMLAVLELASYPAAGIQMWLSPDHALPSKVGGLTAWFAVMVVFVLAEVFREGARLRREAELTI